MNIILLPGMDGTGRLFAPLLTQLSGHRCQAIALPQSGPQDYATLVNFVSDKLPDDDFILIAESFSGPIAAQLAQQYIPSLKGIIFVATFLNSPHRLFVKLAQILPIKWMNNWPGAQSLQKYLFFNKEVDQKLLRLFKEIINSVPSEILRNRLKAIALLEATAFNCSLPCMYISATDDKLVSADKIKNFRHCFENLSVQKINGPHFIAQTRSMECSQTINNFVNRLYQIDHMSVFR